MKKLLIILVLCLSCFSQETIKHSLGGGRQVEVPINTIAPVVTITSPTGGTVSGTITVTVTATEVTGIAKVILYIDGAPYGTVTVAPYNFSWNTLTYSNSTHTLQATGYGNDGLTGNSSVVTVTVNNVPPVNNDPNLPTTWVDNNELTCQLPGQTCYTNSPALTGSNTSGTPLVAPAYELELGLTTGIWVSAAPSLSNCTFTLSNYVTTATGLQTAINDFQTCRTANSGTVGFILDVPPVSQQIYNSGSNLCATGVYCFDTTSGSGGLFIPQNNANRATSGIIVRSTADAILSQLPEPVGAGGIQDNLATSTHIGLNNPDLTGGNMYYALGPTNPTGTFAGGTNPIGIIGGITTLSTNTTALTAVIVTGCSLMTLNSGYVSPGNNYVVTGSDGNTETITGTGCPAAPNQTGLYGNFTKTHGAFGTAGASNSGLGACPANCVAWVSGTQFSSSFVGTTIVINNVPFTVAIVYDVTHLSVTTAPQPSVGAGTWPYSDPWNTTVTFCANGCSYTLQGGVNGSSLPSTINTANYNYAQYMYKIGCSAFPKLAYCTPLQLCSGLSSDGTNYCGVAQGPDHWEFMDGLVQFPNSLNGSGNINGGSLIITGDANALNDPSQFSHDIHFRRMAAQGNWPNIYTGTDSIAQGFNLSGVIYGSVVGSQCSQTVRPGAEGHCGQANGLQTKFDNNWFEGASSSIFAGGFGSTPGGGVVNSFTTSYLPATDLQFGANRTTFPFSWLGLGNVPTCDQNAWPCNTIFSKSPSLVRKNCLEWKSDQRAVIYGLICENTDNSGGQAGITGSWNPRNTSGTLNGASVGQNYQSNLIDTTIENSIFRNSCEGMATDARGPGVSGVTSAQTRTWWNNILEYSATGTNPGCNQQTTGIGYTSGQETWLAVVTENAGTPPTTATATAFAAINSAVSLLKAANASAGSTVYTTTATSLATQGNFFQACGCTYTAKPTPACNFSTTGNYLYVTGFTNTNDNSPAPSLGSLTTAGFQCTAASVTAPWTVTLSNSLGQAEDDSTCTTACPQAYQVVSGTGGVNSLGGAQGYQAVNISSNKPVWVYNCTNTNFNPITQLINGYPIPSSVQGVTTSSGSSAPWNGTWSAANATVTYTWPVNGGPNPGAGVSDTSGTCILSNVQGNLQYSKITHHTLISDATSSLGNGPTSRNGALFISNHLIQDSLFTSQYGAGTAGWYDQAAWQTYPLNNSCGSEGLNTETFNYDTGTLTADHDVWVNRPPACYTAYGNNPQFPVVTPLLYFGADIRSVNPQMGTDYCLGASPSNCVGFAGAMGIGGLNIGTVTDASITRNVLTLTVNTMATPFVPWQEIVTALTCTTPSCSSFLSGTKYVVLTANATTITAALKHSDTTFATVSGTVTGYPMPLTFSDYHLAELCNGNNLGTPTYCGGIASPYHNAAVVSTGSGDAFQNDIGADIPLIDAAQTTNIYACGSRPCGTAGPFPDIWPTTPPAHVFFNTDDSTSGWTVCAKPACNPGGTNAPSNYQGKSGVVIAINSSPNLDGASGSVFQTSPGGGNSNALWTNYNGQHNDSYKLNMDFWFYPTSGWSNLEFDQFLFCKTTDPNGASCPTSPGTEYMFGTQCSLSTGNWQIYDQFNGAWHDISPALFCSGLTNNAWHHIIWNVHRVPGDTTGCSGYGCEYYDQFVLDGAVKCSPCGSYGASALPSSITASNSGWQLQIDITTANTTVTEDFDLANFSITP